MNDYITLVEKNMKLVNFVIHDTKLYIPKFFKKDMRDLYQEGYVLLIKAAKNYDVTTGYKFSTYAVNTIHLGLKTFIDRYSEKRYSYEGYSLEKEVFTHEDGDITWKEFLEIEEDGFLEVILKYSAKNSNIKEIDKIVAMKLEGYKTNEIGERLGVSGKTIYKRLCKLKGLIASA